MPPQKSGAPAPCSACPRVLNLTRFRTKAGISLEDIANGTKISLRFLRAIEEEEFDKLPGGIFSTSYLRQYADAIGYDASELLAFYNQKMNPPLEPSVSQRDENQTRSLVDRWLRMPAEIHH